MNTAGQITILVRAAFEPTNIVEVRFLPSKESVFYHAADLASVAEMLINKNRVGQNVFIGINPRIAAGGKSRDDVAEARVLVADFDHCTLAEAMDRLKKSGLPTPTLIVVSGHGAHAYWLLSEPIIDLAFWTSIQKRLIKLLNTDKLIHDPPRIMRLPGFLNLKSEPYMACEIVEYNADAIHDLGEILPLLPRLGPPRPFRQGSSRIAGSSEVRRASNYIRKMEPSISGQRGHCRAFAAACACIRFGLSPGDAMQVMEHFNTRCAPPWSLKELEHKVSDAREEVGSEFGCLLIDRRIQPVRHPRFRMLASIGGGM